MTHRLISEFGDTSNIQDLFKQFAKEIRGKYSDTYGDRVSLKVKNWKIDLKFYVENNRDSFNTRYTIIRAPFNNLNKFRCSIAPENFSDKIERFFGLKDIETGHQQFDIAFRIKGNDKNNVKLFLDNTKIRSIFLKYDFLNLEIKDDEGWLGNHYPDNKDLLYFSTQNFIYDIDILKDIFELFTESLIQLNKLGIVEDKDPDVPLLV